MHVCVHMQDLPYTYPQTKTCIIIPVQCLYFNKTKNRRKKGQLLSINNEAVKISHLLYAVFLSVYIRNIVSYPYFFSHFCNTRIWESFLITQVFQLLQESYNGVTLNGDERM